ncbi:MAG: AMP-binding protein, partial [Bacteroidota bacterium]|nr:AMP-binding protein [Bacteroidota bacterium]
MTEPTRLFDCIELQLQKEPERVMLAGKENGTWKTYTTHEVSDIVNKLSAGLLKMGISNGDNTPEGRDKIAVISKNRPEWILLDLAVQQIGAVLTPV